MTRPPASHLASLGSNESKPCCCCCCFCLLDRRYRHRDMKRLGWITWDPKESQEYRSPQSWHREGTLFLKNKITHIPDTKGCITMMNVCVRTCACRYIIYIHMRYIMRGVQLIKSWPERAIVVLAEQIYGNQSLVKWISFIVFFRQIKYLGPRPGK